MTARAQGALRLAAVVVAAVLVLGAALEIGTRIYLRARGRPLDRESRRAFVASVCEEMTNRGEVADDLAPPGSKPDAQRGLVLEPYVAWSDAATEKRKVDDAEAYAREDAKAAFDVLILGGTGATEVGADPLLAEVLRADSRCRGRELRLHVYAEPGFKEPQSMILLGELFALGHEPDLVLAVDGREEARTGASNAAMGTHPLFPSVEAWARASRGMRTDWTLAKKIHDVKAARDAARASGERFLALGLDRSAFLGHFALGRLAALRERAARGGRELVDYVAARPRDAELEGPRFDRSAESVAATIAGGWERAVRQMHAMCAARAVDFLAVLEPIPPAEEGRAVEELRSAADRLRAAGVAVEDASKLKVGVADHGASELDGRSLASAIAAGLARPSIRGR